MSTIKKSSHSAPRTAVRYKINTILFVVMAAIFAAATVGGMDAVNRFSKNFRPISDAPALCYDTRESDVNTTIVENAYVCSIYDHDENGDLLPVTSDNDYAMFFYDKYVFSGIINGVYAQVVVGVLGVIATTASLIGAVIYWLHNHRRCE